MRRKDKDSFAERIAATLNSLSAAERQAVRFFQENREDVLVASAADLARKIGTSDATVIRATRALGYSGLDDMRRQLAAELRSSLSPAARLTRTLGEVRKESASALELTVHIHLNSLERLLHDISPELFGTVVERLAAAPRIVVFGIGPSSAMAEYFVVQLRRFGLDSLSLIQTGLLLADGLHRLRKGDLVIILAYSRVYRELDALLKCGSVLKLSTILLTDTLGPTLRKRVDLVLPVARGNAEGFSTHTATLGLIEALLVGLAAKRPADTISQLKALNALRASIAGDDMELPVAAPSAKLAKR
jgi:DNA-binding MurR/RpiR family transcriptional regulator